MALIDGTRRRRGWDDRRRQFKLRVRTRRDDCPGFGSRGGYAVELRVEMRWVVVIPCEEDRAREGGPVGGLGCRVAAIGGDHFNPQPREVGDVLGVVVVVCRDDVAAVAGQEGV